MHAIPLSLSTFGVANSSGASGHLNTYSVQAPLFDRRARISIFSRNQPCFRPSRLWQGARKGIQDRGDRPGAQGIQGALGSQGQAGAQGPQGPNGEKGDKGDPGTSNVRAVQADGAVTCDADEMLVSAFRPGGGAPDGAKCGTTPTIGLCLKKPSVDHKPPVR